MKKDRTNSSLKKIYTYIFFLRRTIKQEAIGSKRPFNTRGKVLPCHLNVSSWGEGIELQKWVADITADKSVSVRPPPMSGLMSLLLLFSCRNNGRFGPPILHMGLKKETSHVFIFLQAPCFANSLATYHAPCLCNFNISIYMKKGNAKRTFTWVENDAGQFN